MTHILKAKKKSRWSDTFFAKIKFRAFCSESIFPFFSLFFFFLQKSILAFFHSDFSVFLKFPKYFSEKKKKVKTSH